MTILKNMQKINIKFTNCIFLQKGIEIANNIRYTDYSDIDKEVYQN